MAAALGRSAGCAGVGSTETAAAALPAPSLPLSPLAVCASGTTMNRGASTGSEGGGSRCPSAG